MADARCRDVRAPRGIRAAGLTFDFLCLQAPALPGLLAAAAIAVAGNEPRDIRVAWIGPVPGLAFIANEVGRRRGCRTMIET
jgi:hypothetical protein